MNKGVVWGVVIIVVLIGAGLLMWQSAGQRGEPVPTSGAFFTPSATLPALPTLQPTFSPAPSVSPTAQPAAATIAITDTGFSPQTTTVAVGTTVTFVNNGQALHWPASDVHPTHQLLPGFDALKGLSTGETYAFTFSQPGSWTCHDHLNPQLKCTIVVE